MHTIACVLALIDNKWRENERKSKGKERDMEIDRGKNQTKWGEERGVKNGEKPSFFIAFRLRRNLPSSVSLKAESDDSHYNSSVDSLGVGPASLLVVYQNKWFCNSWLHRHRPETVRSNQGAASSRLMDGRL